MRAYFCSEERFLRLTICYPDKSSKQQVLQEIEALIKKYEIEPFVEIHCMECDSGELTLEFSDDYNQDARPMLEDICKDLGLEFEESCTNTCSL